MFFQTQKKRGFLKTFFLFFMLKEMSLSYVFAENQKKPQKKSKKEESSVEDSAIDSKKIVKNFEKEKVEKNLPKEKDSASLKKSIENLEGVEPKDSNALETPTDVIFFFQEEESVQIKETFEFPISPGVFDCHIKNLPRGLIEDSLLIEVWGKNNAETSEKNSNENSKIKNSAPVFLKNQIFSNNSLHYPELVESFIGKPIKIKLSKTAHCEEKVISGIFLGLNEKKEPMIFHDEVVDCYPEGYVLFPFKKIPKIFPSLFLKLENSIEQKAKLILHFLCKNIFYHISYLMEIDILKNEMVLQGQMILKNESGKEFDQVKIYWIDRLIQKKSASYGQNIKKILLSKNTKIPSSGKQAIPFLYKKLKPQVTYHAHIPFSFIEAETKEIQNKKILPKRHFSVSCDILNLKEIPDGSLSVYLKQVDQIPIYFLTQKIKSKNSEELQIPLDTHSEIQINVQEIQWRKISDKRKEVTFYILLQNNFSEQTVLHLHQVKKDNLQFLKSHEDPSINNENELIWILEVPAKSTSRFWYRVIVDAQ
jgi:hypothetical protein